MKCVKLVAIGVLILVPAIVMLVLLFRYSVNVPFWDQWSHVDLIDKARSGNLTLNDLWAQHNEHRQLFPKVAVIVTQYFTGYNLKVHTFFNLIVALITFGLLATKVQHLFIKQKWVSFTAMAVMAWLFFSPIQWINWIWSFQLGFFMAVFFVVYSLYLLSKPNVLENNVVFWVAILSGVGATYSLGNGVIIWFVGLVLLRAYGARPRHMIIWVASASLTSLSYFYHFHRSPDSLALVTVIKQPVAVARYVFIYLGRNLAYTVEGAKWTGIVLLLVLLISIFVIYKAKRLKQIWFWLGLVLYVLATAFAAAVSRLNFGVEHAFVFSYTTISVLFVIAVVMMALFALTLFAKTGRSLQPKWLIGAVFLLGLLSYPAGNSFVHNYNKGVALMYDQSRHMHKVENCVYEAISPDDECLTIVYPAPREVWQKIQVLKKLHWGKFE